VTLGEGEGVLFTDITEPAGAAAARRDEATAARLT
jgi:hypothetical protein